MVNEKNENIRKIAIYYAGDCSLSVSSYVHFGCFLLPIHRIKLSELSNRRIYKYFVHGGVVYITHFEDAAMRLFRVVSFSTLIPFVGIGTLIKAKKLRKK